MNPLARFLLCVASAAAFVAPLGACTTVAPGAQPDSPCATSEASYECQVERYRNVDA